MLERRHVLVVDWPVFNDAGVAPQRVGGEIDAIVGNGGIDVCRAIERPEASHKRHDDEPENVARVLRVFVRDGRLTSIPTVHAKRLIVLDWLVQRFEPGRHYPERTVNHIISEVHPDTAALRRYLVDEGLLARDHGEYWRQGGTFDPG